MNRHACLFVCFFAEVWDLVTKNGVVHCTKKRMEKRLEVFEIPRKDTRKFWQPDRPPKTQPISVGMFHGLPSRPCRGSSEESLAGTSEINRAI